MKHIILEGGDQLGKSTIIKKISEFYNYDNITIRHFGKPPKTFPEGVSPFEYQRTCFHKEAELAAYLNFMDEDEPFNYYENILIWNRGHIGEYVYGQMFRKTDPNEIKRYLEDYEKNYLCYETDNPILILLTADPEFFLSKEDGRSFSKNIEQKTKELQLFDEAFENSLILNKIKIKVNKDGEYVHKSDVFEQIKTLL